MIIRWIACLLLSLFPGVALAATNDLQVPQKFPDIQQAVRTAQPGDTITLAAGEYEGPIVIDKSITLKGEGGVVLYVTTSTRPVLKLQGAIEAHLINLTLEYRGKQEEDGTSTPKTAVLAIDGAQARIEKVTCRKAARHGVNIFNGAQVIMRGYRGEQNQGCGIAVQGSGSMAWINEAVLEENKDAGLFVFNGASAEIADTVARKNKNGGLRSQDIPEGSMHLLNCEASENESSGFYLTQTGAMNIENCKSFRNGRYGVETACGAKGKIVGCQLTENKNGGIHAAGVLTDITVERNNITSNYNSGILVEHGASAHIDENILSGNLWNGITVTSLGSRAEITANTCENHPWNGIYVYLEAGGAIRDNHFRGNRDAAIRIANPVVPIEVSGNTAEQNGRDEPVISHEETSDLTWMVDAYYTGWALLQHQYDYLERMVDWCRKHPQWDANLATYYSGIVEGYFPQDAHTAKEKHRAALDEWIQTFPDSTAAREALAAAYIAYAWDARGNGFADTVTEEGWRGLKGNLKEAEKLLEETKKMSGFDVALYAYALNIGKGLGYDTATMDSLMESGAALMPGYFALYGLRGEALLKRWGGNNAEMAAFFKHAYDLSKESSGARIYAQLVGWYVLDFDCADVAAGKAADWDLLDRGFNELIDLYPRSPQYLNQYCKMACLFGKRSLAAELFEKIGDNFDYNSWVNGNPDPNDEEKVFRQYRRWATIDGIPCPCEGAHFSAIARKTPIASDITPAAPIPITPSTISKSLPAYRFQIAIGMIIFSVLLVLGTLCFIIIRLAKFRASKG